MEVSTMTHLSSPSHPGDWPFKATFKSYLLNLIGIDKRDKTVFIYLDEEGNYIWELNEQETMELVEHLLNQVNELRKLK